MAISFSRPDPSSPSAVAAATFSTARRGFDQTEVRDLLRMVAAELGRLQERERFLERELRAAQHTTTSAAVALDDEVVTRMLGEEAARILHTAREGATQIRIRAEEGAARLLREATDEAQRVREELDVEVARRRADASADAEAELQMAKQQGREMVNEARSYRERVLSELSRRRELARQQIEQLVHGRDRLLQAFERARLAAVDVMAELTPLGAPAEYVNLSPTTGPVPVMVPAARPTAIAPAPTVSPPTAAEMLADLEQSLPEPPPARSDDVVSAGAGADVDGPAMYDGAADELSEPAIDPNVVSGAEVSGEDDVAEVVVVEPDVAAPDVSGEADVVAEADVTEDELAVPDDLAAPDVSGEADGAEAEGTGPEVIAAGDDVTGADAEDSDDRDDATHATVVVLHEGADRGGEHADDGSDDSDRAPAPVVTLFAGELDQPPAGRTPASSERSAGELFARLRASRLADVAARATARSTEAAPAGPPTPDVAPDATHDAGDLRTGEHAAEPEGADAAVTEPPVDATVALRRDDLPEAFQRSAEAPAEQPAHDDTPFGRRDAELTPLIVAVARKVKRVLADEQNEVLHTLRRAKSAVTFAELLPAEPDHLARYATAMRAVLEKAAVAGAASLAGDTSVTAQQSAVRAANALDPAIAWFDQWLIAPLRERVERAVYTADGDNDDLSAHIRGIYREWKSQRIDEYLDDVARMAYGRGQLALLAPGTPVCWAVDPNGPECADAEDNSLAGAVPAGQRFPTEHTCAPAHEGCRCLLVTAPR